MLAFIINILSTPSILVGILALVGLILQKKPVEEIVKGTRQLTDCRILPVMKEEEDVNQ